MFKYPKTAQFSYQGRWFRLELNDASMGIARIRRMCVTYPTLTAQVKPFHFSPTRRQIKAPHQGELWNDIFTEGMLTTINLWLANSMGLRLSKFFQLIHG